VRNFFGFNEDGLSAYDFLLSRIVNVDAAGLAVVQKSSHSKVDVRLTLQLVKLYQKVSVEFLFRVK
jgi:hypothetical protein